MFFGSDAAVQEQLAQIAAAEDVLRLAIQFEWDSTEVYIRTQDGTVETEGREFIGQFAGEEKKHLMRLAHEHGKLTPSGK